jgi:hypothetical protein
MPYADPEKQKRYLYEYELKKRKEHPEYFLWKSAKKRAREKGRDFDITPDDIIIPEFCPYLGIPISHEVGGKSRRPGSPSLDRIDSARGYVKGNILVCSWRANNIKSDATLNELITLTKQWSQLQSLSPENQSGTNI